MESEHIHRRLDDLETAIDNLTRALDHQRLALQREIHANNEANGRAHDFFHAEINELTKDLVQTQTLHQRRLAILEGQNSGH